MSSTAQTTATASVDVGADAESAFSAFTDDIGRWWKRGTRYWTDSARGVELRFSPGVGGSLTEVHDPATGEGYEFGRVLVWEPGRRLVFTWRWADWPSDETTEVDVRFEPIAADRTRVTVEHGGWDRAPSVRERLRDGYGHGWVELLDWYAAHVRAR